MTNEPEPYLERERRLVLAILEKRCAAISSTPLPRHQRGRRLRETCGDSRPVIRGSAFENICHALDSTPPTSARDCRAGGAIKRAPTADHASGRTRVRLRRAAVEPLAKQGAWGAGGRGSAGAPANLPRQALPPTMTHG
jgi:hypothetical protein